MIAKAMTGITFVICGDCGSTIYTQDLESLVEAEKDGVWLRCRNNCCGHVSRYTSADLITPTPSQIVDHSTRIFLES